MSDAEVVANRLELLMRGGSKSADELISQIGSYMEADLYVYTDGALRLTALEQPAAEPTEAAWAIAREVADRHVEHEAVWEGSGDLTRALAGVAQAALDRIEKLRGAEAGSAINDGIDAAFDELNATGIVALQCAGYTMSDGWSDVNHRASTRTPPPWGACFYHEQDLERAVAGRGLLLAFGAYEDDDAKHEARSLEVAKRICEVLKKHGVATEWDGTVEQRIRIPPFQWSRRRT